jgi:hypothetical protein
MNQTNSEASRCKGLKYLNSIHDESIEKAIAEIFDFKVLLSDPNFKNFDPAFSLEIMRAITRLSDHEDISSFVVQQLTQFDEHGISAMDISTFIRLLHISSSSGNLSSQVFSALRSSLLKSIIPAL